jgi:hypothetical protein
MFNKRSFNKSNNRKNKEKTKQTNHLLHNVLDDDHLHLYLNYENLINMIDDQLDIIEYPI